MKENSIIERLRAFITSGDERSQKAKKNIILSFGNKAVAIAISLALVPLTINYLDAEQYGIWLTLSSIVAWLSFFDIGLGHGFRNKFAEAKANGEDILARKYVSTTYFSMAIIFGIVLLVFECVNPFIHWASLLKVSQDLNPLLTSVVSIVLIGVCTSFVINVFPIMLSADQKPAASAMIATMGQGTALIVILLITKQAVHDMKYIAFALSWVPVLITLSVSIWMYTHSYKAYAPSLKFVDKSLINNILNLGIKFFVIQISMILIFQVVNIILSRVLGPTSVTIYNVTYKYYSITMMAFSIVLSPYWSAFTDAYTKGDLPWMSMVHKNLNKVWLILLGISSFLFIVSPFAFKIWLKDSVQVPIAVSFSMFIYINVLSYSTMYMTLLNGTGKVFLQMMIYVLSALVAIPLSVSLCSKIGISGILIVLATVYLAQAISARIQMRKILNGNATGIWAR